MTYVRQPKVHKVSFEEPHRLAGLTIKTRGVSIGAFRDIARIFASIGELSGSATATPQQQVAGLDAAVDGIQLVREKFAEYLVWWDMQTQEEDDAPIVDVPPTAEGLAVLDDEEFILLVQDWMEAVGNVPPPSGTGSTSSGMASPVPTIPTVALSSSQAS